MKSRSSFRRSKARKKQIEKERQQERRVRVVGKRYEAFIKENEL